MKMCESRLMLAMLVVGRDSFPDLDGSSTFDIALGPILPFAVLDRASFLK